MPILRVTPDRSEFVSEEFAREELSIYWGNALVTLRKLGELWTPKAIYRYEKASSNLPHPSSDGDNFSNHRNH